MRRRNLFLMLLLVQATGMAAASDIGALWHPRQAERLVRMLDEAPTEGLHAMEAEAAALRLAIGSGDPARISAVARQGALRLAHALRFGSRRDADWEIPNDGDPALIETQLDTAVTQDRLDAYLDTLRPHHPHYAALRDAMTRETDPARRALIGLNLERWRWMPRDLGQRHLIVNIPAFEVVLWDEGRPVEHRPVIVGKLKTPTPIFSTTATGATFNPWWDIPRSIVAESVGALMRNRPAEARRRGYVIMDGRYRQRPGPGNALGLVKLVMPNPHHVYLHDTPAKALFERPTRAFSHGCVRVSDALGLARSLIALPEWDQSRIDRTIAEGKTITTRFHRPLPVYLTYFTAVPDKSGAIEFLDDIYGKDARAQTSKSSLLSSTVPGSPEIAHTADRKISTCCDGDCDRLAGLDYQQFSSRD